MCIIERLRGRLGRVLNGSFVELVVATECECGNSKLESEETVTGGNQSRRGLLDVDEVATLSGDASGRLVVKSQEARMSSVHRNGRGKDFRQQGRDRKRNSILLITHYLYVICILANHISIDQGSD